MLDDIKKLSESRVLIVGDVMLDSYWHGSASRISPEAPVPVVNINLKETRAGGAGNVAINAAALGAKTYLLGLAGQDNAADQLDALLNKSGVKSNLLRVLNSKTIRKLRVLSQHQQLIRLDFEDSFPDCDEKALLANFNNALPHVDVVILSDYAKGTLRGAKEIIASARQAGKPIIVDPKGIDFERYRGASIITPNFSEFEAVVGHCDSDAEIEHRGIQLRDKLDLQAILVTRSEKGMTLLARGQAPVHLTTRARDVFDVTGAGDTVVAVLGVALGAGLSLENSVLLSNIAAGIIVAKLGTATVTPTELAHSISGDSSISNRGLCTEDELLIQISNARTHGERIVMTNGCFDILHPGHIDYLEKARALGDRLIVAVNDDASIQRLKGSMRPVNPLKTRLQMLSALACVDWVVSFSEDTPQNLYCRVLPDILVKGGDYTEDEVAGGECVKKAGGKIKILDLLPGYSTTNLIQKIQDAKLLKENL